MSTLVAESNTPTCIPVCEELVVRSEAQVDAVLIAAAARLKVIGRAGIGVMGHDR